MKFSIVTKIYLGLMVLVALMIVQGFLGLRAFRQTAELGTIIQENRLPASLASAQLRESIQASLAGLRGWMVVANEDFKIQRMAAQQRIHSSLDRMDSAFNQTSNNAGLERLGQLRQLFRQFEALESEIESLAHTLDNTPLIKQFIHELLPPANRVTKAISTMIFRESRRFIGSEDMVLVQGSKALLKSMADFGASFAQSMDDVRLFLLTGDASYREAFEKSWRVNNGAYLTLQRAELSARQKSQFEKLQDEREAVRVLTEKLFLANLGDTIWNVGSWKMAHELLPMAGQLVSTINELATEQDLRMTSDTAALRQALDQGSRATWVILGVGILLALLSAAFISRQVTRPLQLLADRMHYVSNAVREMHRTRNLSMCEADKCRIPVESDDAIGKSAEAFNALVYAMRRAHEVGDAVTALTKTLSSQLDLESLSLMTLDALFLHTGSLAGVVLTENSGELVVSAQQGILEPEKLAENEFVRRALRTLQIQRVALPEELRVEAVLTRFTPREVMVIPVEFKNTPLGVVVLASTIGFTEEDEWLLGIFRQNFGLALNNALVHNKMHRMAVMDMLTGTYNRRFGMTRMGEEFKRAVRSQGPLGILMMDIDFFKKINDTHGHLVGDRVLASTARTTQKALRDGDALTRFGGEEFMVIMPGASLNDSYQIAERIRHLVEEMELRDGERKISVTVSIGLTAYPEDGSVEAAEELLRHADESLYAAKSQGRNRVVVYGASP